MVDVKSEEREVSKIDKLKMTLNQDLRLRFCCYLWKKKNIPFTKDINVIKILPLFMSLSPAVLQSQTEDKAMTKRFCPVLSTLSGCLLRKLQGNYGSNIKGKLSFFVHPDPTKE